MAKKIHHIAKGMTRPVLDVVFDATYGDISGWSEITLIIKLSDTTAMSIAGAVTNGPNGECNFTFSDSDSDQTAGTYPAVIYYDDGSGGTEEIGGFRIAFVDSVQDLL